MDVTAIKKALNLTQWQFAHILQVGQSSVARYEKGEAEPTGAVARKLLILGSVLADTGELALVRGILAGPNGLELLAGLLSIGCKPSESANSTKKVFSSPLAKGMLDTAVGAGAGMFAGVAARGVLGMTLGPAVGLAALAGGLIGAFGKNLVASSDALTKKQSTAMKELMSDVLQELAGRHSLSREEAEAFNRSFLEESSESWWKAMYDSGETNFKRMLFAEKQIAPLVEDYARQVQAQSYSSVGRILKGPLGRELYQLLKDIHEPKIG